MRKLLIIFLLLIIGVLGLSYYLGGEKELERIEQAVIPPEAQQE